jgi:hypothetical protein
VEIADEIDEWMNKCVGKERINDKWEGEGKEGEEKEWKIEERKKEKNEEREMELEWELEGRNKITSL